MLKCLVLGDIIPAKVLRSLKARETCLLEQTSPEIQGNTQNAK